MHYGRRSITAALVLCVVMRDQWSVAESLAASPVMFLWRQVEGWSVTEDREQRLHLHRTYRAKNFVKARDLGLQPPLPHPAVSIALLTNFTH